MTTDPKPIRIQIDADPRFAAGAGGAAHYVAENAGLKHEAATELQEATVQACLVVFSGVSPASPQLDVQLSQFADRIEVAISLTTEAAPTRLDALAKTSAKKLNGVDRVQYEQLGNSYVTRLTKYLNPRP